ncbi:MAG TPA: hypothetical protein VGD09_18375, partial [Blastococcus sp.]
RAGQAEAGIGSLREEVDTLIVIPNDKLLQMVDHQIAILDAFKQADQVLLQGVSGITDLITTPGLINLDFADVKSVMANAGSALMGIGSARGEDRAVAAAEMAVSSPLLEASIDGAHGVLLSIAGGSDLGLFEINEAAALVSQAAHAEANIIFGAVIDDALGDEVRVTVIAAGFDGGMPKRRDSGSALMGIGSARGDNRALLAAEQAIASPLLEASMEGAHGVLLSISGGSDLGLFEINEAASLVSDAAHADANIIFGAVIDDALGDEVRVTVIAAGFDSGRPTRKDAGAPAAQGSTSSSAAGGLPPYRRPVTAPPVHQSAGERRVVPQTAAPQPVSQANGGTPAQAPVRPGQVPPGGGITVPPLPPIPGPVAGRRPLSNEDFEEELDIPEFLKQ